MKKEHEVFMARVQEMLDNAPEGCHPAMVAIAFLKEEGEDIMTGTGAMYDERLTPYAIKHLQEVLKRRIMSFNSPKPLN